MAFRFSHASWTQHAMVGSVVGLGFALGGLETVARGWRWAVETFPADVLFVGGLVGLHGVLYWTVCLAFHGVDTTQRPAFIARYRIQEGRRKEPPLHRVIPVLVVNQFVLLPALLWLFVLGLQARGWTAEAELPTAGRLAFELAAQGVVAPLVFYAGHRLSLIHI